MSMSMSTVEQMNATLPQDRTGAPVSAVLASVSQVDSHLCPGNSRLGPNNPVGSAGSAQTLDNRPQEACASGPDVTRCFLPMEPDAFVPPQHYQTLPFIHPSHQSPPPAPTQHLAQMQLLLAQFQQREEQLQLVVMHQGLWLRQFLQQQQQPQVFQQQQQQQQHPDQFFASRNTPPSQELLPMNNGSLTSTQPWGSESPYPVASQIPLHPSTSAPSASDLAPSSLHAHLPLIFQPEPNLEQNGQPHVPSASLRLAPIVIDCNRIETEHLDRVEARSKTEGKRHQRRFTDEESQDIILRREGDVPESYQTIAKAIGCSKSTAWRKRHKYETQIKLIQKDNSQ
ncbi:MAG: hypothetical protein J3Q66DRAFT_427344 [Benniella sp.]|nr:MAG: hypothetical protein J3Q66DRAFT_427344 [Benniella sp.]